MTTDVEVTTIQSQHVTEPPAILTMFDPALLDPFTPYYQVTIVTNQGTYVGTGPTEAAAEQDAIDALNFARQLEIKAAITCYNTAHGLGIY